MNTGIRQVMALILAAVCLFSTGKVLRQWFAQSEGDDSYASAAAIAQSATAPTAAPTQPPETLPPAAEETAAPTQAPEPVWIPAPVEEEDPVFTTLASIDLTALRQVNPDADTYPRAARAEESLLGVLLLHPDYIKAVGEKMPAEQMVTAFNRSLYTLLLERSRQGLLIELAFLSGDYDEAAMAYITRMMRDAKERTVSMEDVDNYIAIIREEDSLRGMANPADMSDEDIQKMLETLRARKG
jgi:hypothetical protein